MSLIESDYDPHVWGYIKATITPPGTATFAHDMTGTGFNPNISQNDGASPERQKRAYFSFDTSGTPDGAVIDLAEFNFKFNTVSEPVGYNGNWVLSCYYEWDRIGAALTTADWYISTLAGSKAWPSTPVTWVEYTMSLIVGCVNKAGDTDIEVRDVSGYTDPAGPVQYRLVAMRDPGPTHHSYLTIGYLLQGVLGKTPSGNISYYGGMCLATLSKLLMQAGIIPPMSEIDRVEGSDIYVVTKFAPRMVMGACS